MRVIVFFDVCFLYLFCFSQVGILVKIPYNKLSITVWVAYLSSDWSATVSLSVLSYNAGTIGDNTIDPKFVITAFWAPFFLLHLGGPDTITAYSLDDNEL